MASTATRASLGSGSGSGASASSTPGSAEEVRRASTGRTLPIGVRLPAVRESASWTRTPTRARSPLPSPRAGARSRTRGSRRWRRARGRRGARAPEEDCGLRTPLQRDRDRIVHCKAFRRLKHKTQVFVAPEGDHYRTRLTHTLEVTQISRTVARALRLNEDLTEAIGLGHDLGHPPFGHIGEDVLDDCLRERFGRGFRHYEHSLRVVDVLERDGAGPEPDRGRARRDRLPLRPRAAAARRSRAGSCGSSTASPTSTTTSTTRCAPACCATEELPAEPIAVLGDTGSRADRRARARPGRALRGGRRHRPGRRGRRARWTSCGPSCSTTSTSARSRAREHARIERVLRTLFEHYVGRARPAPRRRRRARTPTVAQRVTDYLAGMTDRYCIRAFEELTVPRGVRRARLDAVALLHRRLARPRPRRGRHGRPRRRARPSCGAPASTASRGCARSTTSARRRSGSTRPRSSTTASAAARAATSSSSSRRPRASTSRARWSSSPTATASSSSSRRRTRGGRAARSERERLLELLERTAAFYVRYLWESEEAAHAREYLAGRGLDEESAARVPRRLRAERVGQGARRPRGAPASPSASSWRPGSRRARSKKGAHLRPLPPADHVPALRRSAGACSASARARWAPTRSPSTSTRPTTSSTTRAATCSAPTSRGRRRPRRARSSSARATPTSSRCTRPGCATPSG